MILHSAGEVVYDVAGFTEKNKDLISDHITETLQSSELSLLQVLFPKAKAGQKPVARRGSKITGFSLTSQFVVQLRDLMAKINDSVPRYVRCIKPNKIKSGSAQDIDLSSVKH